jgi:hypothetical protein
MGSLGTLLATLGTWSEGELANGDHIVLSNDTMGERRSEDPQVGLALEESFAFQACSGNRGGGARYTDVAAIQVNVLAVIAQWLP